MKKEDVLDENHHVNNLEKQGVESSMNHDMYFINYVFLTGESLLMKLLKQYVQNNPLTLPSWIYLVKSLIPLEEKRGVTARP